MITDKYNTYVTYLKRYTDFDPDKIEILLSNRRNGCLFKPDKGFWGSPVNANYGWREWCENEEFGDYDFEKPVYWTLTDGKILQIDWDEVTDKSSNLMKYVVDDKSGTYNYSHLDWEKMIKDGVVAVQLMNACIGHVFKNVIESKFNAWDCESIVVLDKSKIKFLEEA